MKDINVRFKKLRNACDMSQEDFGKILGLTKSGVSDIERGKRNVTAQHLIMLSNWTERKVNIDYLETGNGPMFLEPKENDVIAQATALLGEKDPLFEAFVITYSKLNPKNRELLLQFMTDMVESIDKKKE